MATGADTVAGMRSLTSEELGSAAQQERRRRILDATIALASAGGFDAVQMRTVAEHADVALGTLYRYFPSKIHLLVSALGREFEQAVEFLERKPVPGDTAADRVTYVLERTTRALQRDPNLTEALTRAIADPDVPYAEHEPTEEELAIAKVIGDVWLASLVQWVTGRASAEDVAKSMEVAARLLLR